MRNAWVAFFYTGKFSFLSHILRLTHILDSNVLSTLRHAKVGQIRLVIWLARMRLLHMVPSISVDFSVRHLVHKLYTAINILLVSLPELIAQTNMDQQSVARLREELSKLTNWLGKEVNMPKYFVSEYETPSQAYVEKARNF